MRFRQFFSAPLKVAVLVLFCSIVLSAGGQERDHSRGHDRDRDRGHEHWDHGHEHCKKSPENPSLVLAALGTAGVAWQYFWQRTRL